MRRSIAVGPSTTHRSSPSASSCMAPGYGRGRAAARGERHIPIFSGTLPDRRVRGTLADTRPRGPPRRETPGRSVEPPPRHRPRPRLAPCEPDGDGAPGAVLPRALCHPRSGARVWARAAWNLVLDGTCGARRGRVGGCSVPSRLSRPVLLALGTGPGCRGSVSCRGHGPRDGSGCCASPGVGGCVGTPRGVQATNAIPMTMGSDTSEAIEVTVVIVLSAPWVVRPRRALNIQKKLLLT